MDEQILAQLAQLQQQQLDRQQLERQQMTQTQDTLEQLLGDREPDTMEQLLALQRLQGTPKEKLVAEGGEYSYEFQPEQAEKLEGLSKAIDILQDKMENSPKQNAVAAMGILGLLSTLAAVAYGKK
jgi:hypothetical protein